MAGRDITEGLPLNVGNPGLTGFWTNSGEDYDCWLKALQHTNSVYVEDVCFYYDDGHGYGQNY